MAEAANMLIEVVKAAAGCAGSRQRAATAAAGYLRRCELGSSTLGRSALDAAAVREAQAAFGIGRLAGGILESVAGQNQDHRTRQVGVEAQGRERRRGGRLDADPFAPAEIEHCRPDRGIADRHGIAVAERISARVRVPSSG